MAKLTQKRVKEAFYNTFGLYAIAIWLSFIYLIYPSLVEALPPEDSILYIASSMYQLLLGIGAVANPIGWILVFGDISRDPRLYATIGLGWVWFMAFFFTFRELKRKR